MTDSLDLTPDAADVTVYRGDGRPITVRFYTDDTKATGADLTDPARTWLCQLRDSRRADGGVVGALDVDDTDADTGVLVLTVPDDIPAGVFVWDLQWLVTGSDLPLTVCSGSFTVTGDVSRA